MRRRENANQMTFNLYGQINVFIVSEKFISLNTLVSGNRVSTDDILVKMKLSATHGRQCTRSDFCRIKRY